MKAESIIERFGGGRCYCGAYRPNLYTTCSGCGEPGRVARPPHLDRPRPRKGERLAFCVVCGSPSLARSMSCPGCEARRIEAAKVCPVCGGAKSVEAARCRRCSDSVERDHYFAIVIDGYRDGLQAWEIAERIGDTAQHVSARAARLRADGVDVPFGRRGMHRSPGGPWVPVLVKDTITCTMCGKQTPREGGHQKYCPDCRVVARREGSTRRQREMAHRRATPCIDCGGPCGREGAERCRRCDRARRSRRARERAEEYLSLRKSGFTNAEIAEWCGVSPNEVSGAIHRYCPNAPRAPHPKRRTEVAS